MLPKILIVLALLLIVSSLGFALVYLLKDRNRSPRTVKALTARIGMSVALFVLLLMGFQAGVLHPHGLRQGAPAVKTAASAPIPQPSAEQAPAPR